MSGGAPCPGKKCNSSDAYFIDPRGWGHCFSCGINVKPNATAEVRPLSKPVKKPSPIPEDHKGERGISQRTMTTMGYASGPYKAESNARHVLVPHGDGKGHCATKVRLPGKDFRYIGDTQQAGLIFQNKWQQGGLKVVVTEGEYDALSIAEMDGCKYPVVSLPNGSSAALQACTNAYKWLDSFKEVVLFFDNDEPGVDAAQEVAALFPIGKVKIATAPEGFKDANDLLQAGKVKAISDAIWRAAPYTPARFISFSSLKAEVMADPIVGLPWIFDEMNEYTFGRRSGETYYFGAGTGVGKTCFFTQQAAADIKAGEKVAMFSFEQQPAETARRLAGKEAGKLFHIPADEGYWTKDELEASFDRLDKAGAYIYKHDGQAEWPTVQQDITLMAHQGYRHFYIDNITAFTANDPDEKKMLEGMCADVSNLAKKLDIYIYVISHLSTPKGTPHEEGGRVFISHFKGSRAIGFWPNFLFGIERDTQASDPQEKLRAKLRCLKDRYTGRGTGQVITMKFDPMTGLQSVDSSWVWEDKGAAKGDSWGGEF